MNERQQAIDLLRRARDILAERVTEHVLRHKDDILEDAIGLASQSEIDALYEQLGIRLAHVNQLLANLPVPEGTTATATADQGETTTAEAAPAEHDAPAFPGGPTSYGEAFHELPEPTPPPLPTPVLPAPAKVLRLAGPDAAVSFQRFATRIFVGDLDGAAVVLADLFELEVPRARRCAQVFYDGVRHNPQVIGKAAQLRRELQSGGFTAALSLLHDCFGLQGMESVSVLQSLRARMSRSR